jgi:TM2 domain-containing membrane protein YozV
VSQTNRQIDQTARVAGLVGQIGCVTGFVAIVIIALALGVGQFLDSRFGTGGIITVLFTIGSFPITLYAIVRISLAAVARAQQPVEDDKTENKAESITNEEEAEK